MLLLKLSDDLLMRLAGFTDLGSLQALCTCNKRFYYDRFIQADTGLVKWLVETLYPSTRLIKIEKYLPFLQRKRVNVRSNEEYVLRMVQKDVDGKTISVDLNYQLSRGEVEEDDEEEDDEEEDEDPIRYKAVGLVDHVMEPNTEFQIVVLAAKDNSIEYARFFPEHRTYLKDNEYELPGCAFVPSYLRTLCINRLDGKITVTFPKNKLWKFVLDNSPRLVEEAATRLFGDPECIVDSCAFAFLLDIFAQAIDSNHIRPVYSGLLELNRKQTGYLGQNRLEELRPDVDLQTNFVPGPVIFDKSCFCIRMGNEVYWSKITIVRADGAVMFCPRLSLDVPPDYGRKVFSSLFGGLNHARNVIGYRDICASRKPLSRDETILYSVDILVGGGGRILAARLIRNIILPAYRQAHGCKYVHYSGSDHPLPAGKIRNFGADCYGRGWNHECQVSIRPDLVGVRGFNVHKLSRVRKGKQVYKLSDVVSHRLQCWSYVEWEKRFDPKLLEYMKNCDWEGSHENDLSLFAYVKAEVVQERERERFSHDEEDSDKDEDGDADVDDGSR